MGRTLDALIAQSGVELRTVVAIEGIKQLLTDGHTTAQRAAVDTAWSGYGHAAVLGGLRVAYGLDQRLEPWEPFDTSASRVTLSVTDTDGADVLGRLMFKREPDLSSLLMEDLSPIELDVTVKRSDGLAADDIIHIGCEAMLVDSNDTGAETFTIAERGMWSPFKTSTGDGLGRSHYAAAAVPGVDIESMPTTLVTDDPIEWKGRWVGVWLHRVVDGVLDTKAEAHLVFAGRIGDVADAEDGSTVIHCADVREAISDAVIMRRQWTATVKDGIWLHAGVRFVATNFREAPFSSGEANDLRVVASGAVGVNEINEGHYTGFEIQDAINAWLAAELAAGRLTFKLQFKYDDQINNDVRSSLAMSDPGSSASTKRDWEISCSSATYKRFFGWGDDGITGRTTAPAATAYSESSPHSVYFADGDAIELTLQIEGASGEFVDQTTLMVGGLARAGCLRIGNAYVLCDEPVVVNGDGSVVIRRATVNQLLGLPEIGAEGPIIANGHGVAGWNGAGRVEIRQVLCLESTFKVLTLALLLSTGGANWPFYDVLPASCGAGIPFDLIGVGLESELHACPGAADTMRVIVDKPTRLPELLEASFLLRRIQFVWRRGRLALRGFSTPTSGAALSIGTDDRAVPIGTKDSQRAVTRQSEEWIRNVIKIESNAEPLTGTYHETTEIEIPGSVANYGGRPLTIKARNAVKNAGLAGEDVTALLPTFIAPMSFLAQPATLVTVPIGFNMFEQATPGEVCLFSDDFARDPASGRRGVTNKPALVVGQRIFGYGGESGPATGEIDLMLFPRFSLAPYSPCAEVDNTAAGGGYNAGTKTLTCKAHEHSESTAAVDASHFAPGDEVTVIQIDPDGAPLSFTDKVDGVVGNAMTLITGLAGWDSSKRYRVVSRGYVDAVTTQRTDAYQADDADGQIADLRAPYGLTFHPTGQTIDATDSAATELVERMPTAAYGDGVPLDTGHARGIARAVNALPNYAMAPQYPEVIEEIAFSGAGTWQLVEASPVYVQPGRPLPGQVRKLYVAPTFKATSGTAQVRYTLSTFMPESADPTALSRDDVTHNAPNAQITFSTTSATYATATPVGISTNHLNLGDGPMGGFAWLCVEIDNGTTYRGTGALYVGPMEAA